MYADQVRRVGLQCTVWTTLHNTIYPQRVCKCPLNYRIRASQMYGGYPVVTPLTPAPPPQQQGHQKEE